jgi:putative membrane protein insertion efficiency factor
MKRFAAGLIRSYQVALSPLLGANCRFSPTCSEYAREFTLHHGVLVGGLRSAWRPPLAPRRIRPGFQRY